MSEERLLILKMLEAGKITAGEAAALLDAMREGDEKGDDDEDREGGWARLEKHGEDFAHKVEQAADRFSRTLEAKLEGGLAEKLASLPRILAKIPFMAGTESHEFTQEFSGTFSSSHPEVPLRLSSANGPIMVEGWDQEHFKLVVIQKVRAKDRETARTKVVEIPLKESGQELDELVVQLAHQIDVTLAYQLYLPRQFKYNLLLVANNGRVSVTNISGTIIKAMTTNGAMLVRQVKAKEIDVTTSNGSCKLDYVESETIRQRTGNGSLKVSGSAKLIECGSTNGSVTVAPLTFAYPESEIKLETTNGSLRCVLPQVAGLGVSADASTAVGKVQVDIPHFEFSINEKRAGIHRISGTASGDGATSIRINAKTNSGSIVIAREESSHGTK